MTTLHVHGAQRAQDLFGQSIAARLSASTLDLPHDACERLRAARVRAVSERRVGALHTQPAFASGHNGALHLFWNGSSRWNWLVLGLPVLVLAAGLVAINLVQDERRASELAEVDAALLIDELPPAAYADAGFVQFLKAER